MPLSTQPLLQYTTACSPPCMLLSPTPSTQLSTLTVTQHRCTVLRHTSTKHEHARVHVPALTPIKHHSHQITSNRWSWMPSTLSLQCIVKVVACNACFMLPCCGWLVIPHKHARYVPAPASPHPCHPPSLPQRRPFFVCRVHSRASPSLHATV